MKLNSGSTHVTATHPTEKEAIKEAKRLCAANHEEFAVVKTMCVVRPTCPPVEVVRAKDYKPHDDGIPF